jgi:hypothetical protein
MGAWQWRQENMDSSSTDQESQWDNSMQDLKDYILFRKFIMPVALQILFWSGIMGTFYGSWWLYSNDNRAWLLALLFGVLVTRLIFESFQIRYQTYIILTEIHSKLDKT